jgi:hypothetical protein
MRGEGSSGACRVPVAFLPDEDAFLILDALVVFAEDIFPPEEDALLTLDFFDCLAKDLFAGDNTFEDPVASDAVGAVPSLPRLRLIERAFAMSRDIVPVRAT